MEAKRGLARVIAGLAVAAVICVLGVMLPASIHRSATPRADAPADKLAWSACGPCESAQEASLVWLARHQSSDGHWEPSGICSRCQGPARRTALEGELDVALTSLSLLGFLGAGYTPSDRSTYTDRVTGERRSFGNVVRTGLEWLLDRQGKDGALAPMTGIATFEHALGTLALCEAHRLTKAQRYRAAAQESVRFLELARLDEPGWGRAPCDPSDVETTFFSVLALESAESAGLQVNHAGLHEARAWLVQQALRAGGPKHEVHPLAQLAGLLALAHDEGWPRESWFPPASFHGEPALEVVRAARSDLPTWNFPFSEGQDDSLYWFVGTLSSYEQDGPTGPSWKRWGKPLADTLCFNQHVRRDGCLDGSWEPRDKGPLGLEGGRVYATAMNVLSLEVYYRYASVLGVRRKRPA